MKPRHQAAVLIMLTLACVALAGQRTDLWKKVQEAESKRRPKTAVENLEPIIEQSLKEGAYAEAIKAITKKITLEGNIQGGKAEEKILRLQAFMTDCPKTIQPVMQTILAHWYWQYFQQNRWRFTQRTQTGESPGDDILTWDLPRILSEIDKHFTKALSFDKYLKTIPVTEYDFLLTKGNAPDAFRPTMYDFLAHEALSFYSAGEQAGSKSQFSFDLDAASPVFDGPEGFMAWTIETDDSESSTVKALQLYQQLMRFHKQDKDPSAFVDADLGRLTYAQNTAFGEEKDTRYKNALEQFVKRNKTHRIAARAIHQWATIIHAEGDLVAARKLALSGVENYPDTPGGNNCYNLIQSIESKSIAVSTERVWNAPWPDITIRYKNINKVHFRIVPYKWNDVLSTGHWSFEQLQGKDRDRLLKLPPVNTWSKQLPETLDFQQREETIAVPRDLKPGFYFLVSSEKEDFRKNDNQVHFTAFWVSNLSMIIRSQHGAGQVEGFVLDARTGEPVQECMVRSWIRSNNGKYTAAASTSTDINGLFALTLSNHKAYVLLAGTGEHRISSQNPISAYQQNRKRDPFTRTLFFTDRALYRPGQTVRFKGICVRSDQQNNDYHVLPQQSLTVVFKDVNRKEIERLALTANDYGAFNGSFTAPRDRLMGRMSIQISSGPSGSTFLNVEEYKRPKFRVELDKPKTAPRLDDAVTLTGHATAYTGAAIDDAAVSYRVVREVQFPIWWRWCFWWWPPVQGTSQEITHGSVRTETDGSFKIHFQATPDRSVNRTAEPTFRYTVYADVTDSAGETRSGQRIVNVGYTALKASLSATEWQTESAPVNLRVETRTLDGEPQTAKGTVKIHKLKEPATVQRSAAPGHRPYFHPSMRAGGLPNSQKDLSDPNTWELGKVIESTRFETDAFGNTKMAFKLKAGHYRAILETQDRFGTSVSAMRPIRVVNSDSTRCTLKIPYLFSSERTSAKPGETFSALWGTGYKTGRAFVEIEHRGELIKRYWTDPKQTQHTITQRVDESMRGGFTVHVTMVRENRAYLTKQSISVPWSNKKLNIKWEHFTSKLGPGEKETWTAVITGPDNEAATAEMVAALYDQSLDAYLPHRWQQAINVFYHDTSRRNAQFQSSTRWLQHLQGNWPHHHRNGSLTYRTFPRDITAFWRHHYPKLMRASIRLNPMDAPMAQSMEAAAEPQPSVSSTLSEAVDPFSDGVAMNRMNGRASASGAATEKAAPPEPKPDLSTVTARKNLEETAFFFPHLISGKDGAVRMEFTMPEALTQWKFMGFAHDATLRSGYLQDSVVTAKDLMVQPNPPRFLREGDVLEFSVKILNQSDEIQKGTARLTFSDVQSAKSRDTELSNTTTDQAFEIPSKESRSLFWRIAVPDGMGFLTYKAVAATDTLSDGEEGYLPVLSRRILVTESLPLPIRDAQTKKFRFDKLADSGKSDSLRHQSLTVQMVSQPAWYAVMALPYLMEYPHQCSEQTFNRLYANALARHIAQSDPKIRRVFDLWKGTDALDSPLEKNQDLKAVMLEETPWVRQADNESQARRNVGILFDNNRLDAEINRAMKRLEELQRGNGSWSWFPGGPKNDYITLYITTGFGRLRHLGVKGIDIDLAIKATPRLDAWIDKTYRDILKHSDPDKNHLSPTICLYLYCRSFFLEDKAISAKHRKAVDYFLDQADKYWTTLRNRQSEAHLAIGLTRFGRDSSTTQDIMISLRERAVTSEELGMFWRDTEHSWWWFRAPIETQAMMIEAFNEVAKDVESVENCKVWLLKQKQTQDWKTTKATADAVYGLLLRGTGLLSSDKLVDVALGGEWIKPEKVEAGTGFYEKRFAGTEIKPKMGEITVRKVDEGVSWGSVHWQYLEDMSKVTPHSATPLTLRKTLYIKENTAKGPILTPVKNGKLKVGNELVVRIELRTDRDMEYVHMKDQRGCGTEPVNVLSQYKYQDGLAYYESTRDTASHFFIDYLPKGTYVFEYSVRIQHKGAYQSGMAQIQCMYAPEFNSHSESFPLTTE